MHLTCIVLGAGFAPIFCRHAEGESTGSPAELAQGGMVVTGGEQVGAQQNQRAGQPGGQRRCE